MDNFRGFRGLCLWDLSPIRPRGGALPQMRSVSVNETNAPDATFENAEEFFCSGNNRGTFDQRDARSRNGVVWLSLPAARFWIDLL
jgi:hypothetical protein